MRVISGKYRSRLLRSARGMDIRPTADRLRETLFDVLCAGNPSSLEGSVWFDLYSGVGAVGIEALSRGAGMVYFVDSASQAASLVKSNLTSLGVESGFEIVRKDVDRALPEFSAREILANFVFFDPPYRKKDAYETTLRLLERLNTLRGGALVIAEHHKKFDPGDGFGSLRRYRTLVQGDAGLSFYRKMESGQENPPA